MSAERQTGSNAARTREIIAQRTVTFEETGETRPVAGDCVICFRGHEVYGSGVVSPAGITPHRHDRRGETYCGKDATADNWWWPL